MTRRGFLFQPVAAVPDTFVLTWNEFVKTLGEWDTRYRNDGVFDRKLWDKADKLWQRLHGYKSCR